MKQNYTSISLIKFLYKETSASESLAISEALRQNSELRQEYKELRAAYQQLPQVTFNAPKARLQCVLNYSKHAALEECWLIYRRKRKMAVRIIPDSHFF